MGDGASTPGCTDNTGSYSPAGCSSLRWSSWSIRYIKGSRSTKSTTAHNQRQTNRPIWPNGNFHSILSYLLFPCLESCREKRAYKMQASKSQGSRTREQGCSRRRFELFRLVRLTLLPFRCSTSTGSFEFMVMISLHYYSLSSALFLSSRFAVHFASYCSNMHVIMNLHAPSWANNQPQMTWSLAGYSSSGIPDAVTSVLLNRNSPGRKCFDIAWLLTAWTGETPRESITSTDQNTCLQYFTHSISIGLQASYNTIPRLFGLMDRKNERRRRRRRWDETAKERKKKI